LFFVEKFSRYCAKVLIVSVIFPTTQTLSANTWQKAVYLRESPQAFNLCGFHAAVLSLEGHVKKHTPLLYLKSIMFRLFMTMLCASLGIHIAQAQTKPRIIFVVTSGVDLTPASDVHAILRPTLGKRARIIPSDQVRWGLRRLKTTATALKSPKMATKMARLLKAVLVVVVERKKKGSYPGLSITSITIRTGRLRRQIVPFKKSRFSSASLQKIAVFFRPIFGTLPFPSTSALARRDANKKRLKRSYGGKGVLDGADPTEAGQAVVEHSKREEGVNEATNENNAGSEVSEGESKKAGETDEQDSDKEATAAASSGQSKENRPIGVRFEAGLGLQQRNATMSSPYPLNNISLPCYCGAGKDSNPFSPGFDYRLELFPGMWVGKTASSEQSVYRYPKNHVGLLMGGFITATEATIANGSAEKSTIKGLAATFRGALAYRIFLTESSKPITLTPKVGAGLYHFTMKQNYFPAAFYVSPSAGCIFSTHLGHPAAHFLLDFDYLFAMGNSKSTADLLGRPLLGQGIRIEGGFRFVPIRHLEILAKSSFEYYENRYRGTSQYANQAGENLNIRDVKIIDRNIYLTFNIGVTD
jgi:hypothetical protein